LVHPPYSRYCPRKLLSVRNCERLTWRMHGRHTRRLERKGLWHFEHDFRRRIDGIISRLNGKITTSP
jgi:hypothetical protein